MSLGGAKSKAVNDAAAQMVSAGVFLAVAAGNDNADAADSSPASELSACTVGAITNTDARASYSNFGPIVDIFAPGSDIKSSWIGSKSASVSFYSSIHATKANPTQKTISGTSMATPHITGLGAYLLTLLGKKTPQELCSFIQSTAISGAITDIPSGTNNLLAFNGNPSG